jgi:hypothetical protein
MSCHISKNTITKIRLKLKTFHAKNEISQVRAQIKFFLFKKGTTIKETLRYKLGNEHQHFIIDYIYFCRLLTFILFIYSNGASRIEGNDRFLASRPAGEHNPGWQWPDFPCFNFSRSLPSLLLSFSQLLEMALVIGRVWWIISDSYHLAFIPSCPVFWSFWSSGCSEQKGLFRSLQCLFTVF